MKISIIAAVAANGVIGRDNRLPWYLPADLRYFKGLTMGHHLLMGRKTFESLGGGLPGRTIIVVSRSRKYGMKGVLSAQSLEEGISLARKDEELFIAGGEQIYRLALGCADGMYLTRVHHSFEGDTCFPHFDESDWVLVDRKDHPKDTDNPYAHSFLVYRRRC